MNYWLLMLLVLPPVLIFSGRKSVELAFARALAALVLGWVLLQFAVDWVWKLKIANLPPNPTEQEMIDATADGGPRMGALCFGWIPVGFYIGFWLLGWLWFRARNRRNAMTLMAGFR